jgi:diphthine-ammonia ligase
MRVAASWSGGKDSCLACYEAILKGFEVSNLLNFVFKDVSKWSPRKVSNLLNFVFKDVSRWSPRKVSNLLNLFFKDVSKWTLHKADPEVIAMQAQAMEIPIVQRETAWDEFEGQFKSTIRRLDPTDVEGVVWGIVSPHYPVDSSEKLRQYSILEAQEDWIRRVCSELRIKPITPLWGRDPEQNLVDFVDKGFEAIVVVVNADLGEEWLGRKIDHNFLQDIRRLKRERNIHVCGQLGEYHTLVTDGPLFKKRLEVLQSKKVSRDNYLFLDISKVELIEKAEMQKDDSS